MQLTESWSSFLTHLEFEYSLCNFMVHNLWKIVKKCTAKYTNKQLC